MDGAAIAAVSHGVRMETAPPGGLLVATWRRVRGASARPRRLTATGPGGTVELARRPPCDIEHVRLDGELVIDRAALLAWTGGVTVAVERAGARRVLAGGAPLRLRCSGRGEVWIRCRDPVHRLDVDGSYALDGTHLLAHDAGLVPVVHTLGARRSLLLSGEGHVLELVGRGRVWFRTRVGSG